jgi:hypothetical protein
MYSDIHSEDNSARIYEDTRGHLWVTNEELLSCGYTNPKHFDVVFLNGKFYELYHLMREPMGWWIGEVGGTTTEASSEETHSPAEGGSASL